MPCRWIYCTSTNGRLSGGFRSRRLRLAWMARSASFYSGKACPRVQGLRKDPGLLGTSSPSNFRSISIIIWFSVHISQSIQQTTHLYAMKGFVCVITADTAFASIRCIKAIDAAHRMRHVFFIFAIGTRRLLLDPIVPVQLVKERLAKDDPF